jgi:hypothetical protein
MLFQRTGKGVSLSEELCQSIARYIEENLLDTRKPSFYGAAPQSCQRRILRQTEMGDSYVAEKLQSAPPAAMKAASLEEMLQQADAGFTETLLKLMDNTGKKDAEIYKKANISKQHFSKIRNNPHYKPTKATALALALALELDLEETKDLIGRAGYALTNSSKFDLILRFYIEKRNYNIIEINMVLYEFDQPLLGS